ncbi:MAG TPA: M1 family aminopeptidase [Thermoanaerobaculia bacterium]|nr:M1 family aminopeptidase [Thermoanaerobaculia bacterium]
MRQLHCNGFVCPWLAATLALGLTLAPLATGSSPAAIAAITAITASGATGAPTATVRGADPTYAALRAARPDGRVIAVQGLVLERDAFRFQFDSGAFHFLAPVGGRTVGAVFVGQGSYRLSPATPAERRHLALASGSGRGFEALADSFDELVLLFADDSAAEIALAAAPAPADKRSPNPKALEVYERWMKRQRTDFKLNLQLRLVEDLLNAPGLTSGVFMALVEGKKVPPALAAVDPNGAEALGISPRLGGENTLLCVAEANRCGIWYLADRKAEVERHYVSPVKRLAHALDYKVETTVKRDADLAGTTTIRFQVLSPGLRVLPIYLLPKLRIQETAFALVEGAGASAWQAAGFVQEDPKEDAAAAVVFPEPLAAKATVLVRISYRGDSVLADAGDKNYVVGARESWYANLSVFSDPAIFELIYRVPAGNDIVSVGRLVDARTEGKESVSVWKTDTAVQVAGFNYGRFRKLEKRDEVSGIDVAVYTNPGTPDIVRTINEILSSDSRRELREVDLDGMVANGAPGPSLGTVNTARLADSALADGLNAARIFATYFGPLPEKHVAITQQSQWSFGQSWPSLIFLPYLSFLDGTQRQRLNLTGAADFIDRVGFHEFAHQWWGDLVGAESYRDQWLEEGFAEFSAALAVQHTLGWGAYEKAWRDARRLLFTKLPGNAMAAVDVGPITQGWRLSTPRAPAAYQVLVYSKGAYVLHMLRMLMWEGGTQNPDRRFIAMMKDYAATYGGKQASTADFQSVVERHMVPAMNATGNSKMDWFFNQWVYGTEVPRYEADLSLEPQGGDQVRIKGKITQEGVSSEFRALLPIYLEFSQGERARVALLPLVGTTTVPIDAVVKPPKKPRRALINARSEVLARD